jgi:hypothetical protein
MDKPELIKRLNHLRDVVVLGLALERTLSFETLSAHSRASESSSPLGTHLADLLSVVRDGDNASEDVGDDESVDATRAASIREDLSWLLRSSLVRLSHEMLKGYCESTDQLDLYRTAPWYQFVRIWRNAASHADGAELEKWPPDLVRLGIDEVCWHGHTLRSSQVGKPFTLALEQTLRLHAEMLSFANDVLR